QFLWFDRGPDQQGRLLLIVHHLVMDGVSLRVLLADLVVCYEALAGGRSPDPQVVPVSFRHWARALAAQAGSPERRAELPQWISVVSDTNPLTVLAPDVPDGARHEVTATVPADVTSTILTAAPAAFHAEINDILLATLVTALSAWSRRHGRADPRDFLIDVESHGRVPLSPTMDLSRTVGWFTEQHPVRLSADAADLAGVRAGGVAAGRIVKRAKEELRAVPGDGLGYGILRFLDPETSPVLAALPSARIGFNYLGRLPEAADPAPDWGRVPDGDGYTDTSGAIPAAHSLEVLGLVRDGAASSVLTLVLAAPRLMVAEAELRSLAGDWAAALSGLARHVSRPGSGGHTPSDFSLIKLSQRQIDKLEGAFSNEGVVQ
ncbi:condensation domain-containing protein, partial [Actinoplanes cyaneus]